jgi:hypothetical protein
MAVRLVDPGTDRFMNGWLLQLQSDSALEPIRHFSYLLDPDDDAQVCAAIVAWEGPVNVQTADPQLEQRLTKLCPDADFAVIER